MSETTHDCEWLVYTTYKDGDLGIVYDCFFHIVLVADDENPQLFFVKCVL